MPRKGTYYLGRVVKTGALNVDDIITALREPESIIHYSVAWTLLDIQELLDGRTKYFFGRLVKYDPKAEVSIVDPKEKKVIRRREPNMTIASSPFIYIPDLSGISFLHISNQIEYKTFMSRWADVVNASHGRILAKCDIDPITDLRSFAKKLRSLDGIYKITATVSPPNPLFGPLWKELKEYLEQRKADRLKHQEDSNQHTPLQTELVEHVEGIVNQERNMPYSPGPLPIGDAAILMAADGYGKGYVQGKQGEELVTIKTSETVRNFTFARDPDPEKLYEKTRQILRDIEEERHMEH